MFKRFLAAAKLAAEALDDKKADDILLLDAKKTPAVADYFVLASVDSHVQLSSCADHVTRRLREEFRLHPVHSDGRRSDHWIALDYGAIVVHVMHRNSREFYALERLWEGSRRVKWQETSEKVDSK